MEEKQADCCTRKKVLESACRIFAEQGYRNATVARICREADANVAAVKYYFGSKEKLYVEAFRHAHHVASTRYPVTAGLAPDAPPEQRLEAHIEALLRRIFADGPARFFPHMLVKELAEPTATLGIVIGECLRDEREVLLITLRRLLGPDVPQEYLHRMFLTTVSQCSFFAFNRAIRNRYLRVEADSAERLNSLIRHIYRVTLAGINCERSRYLMPHAE